MNHLTCLAKRHYPIWFALSVLWITIFVFVVLSMAKTDGHLGYSLDDPYIHMAMAKNFSEHAIWGVTKQGFSSATSSPVWVLLLALAYTSFGVSELTPFLLNVFLATFLCVLLYVFLQRIQVGQFLTLVILLALVFFTPLPTLVFVGQEHMLHIVLTLLVLFLAARLLSQRDPKRLLWAPLCLFAPMLVMTRYEGVFMLSMVAMLLLLQRRYYSSLVIMTLSLAPIAIYGWISISNGWDFLPSSLMLKGNLPNIHSLRSIGAFLFAPITQLVKEPAMLVLVVGILAMLGTEMAMREKMRRELVYGLVIALGGALLHLQFAKIGWFYRYEAYLVALAFILLGIWANVFVRPAMTRRLFSDIKLEHLALAASAAFLILPLLWRGAGALGKIPQAVANIHDQQYQMALFLKDFYIGEPVAANDIGAISYFTDVQLLDLWGLGSIEVARTKRDGRYVTSTLDQIAGSKHTKIAIAYDDWYSTGEFGGFPKQWVKVGQWKIAHNVVAASDAVSWYAVDPSEAETLRNHLMEFATRLPSSVSQSIDGPK